MRRTPHRGARRPVVRALAAAAAVAMMVTATRAAAGPTEYEVKAAFLYNFAKFVEWPGAVDEFCFGVAGPDPFGAALDALLAGKTLHDRPIAIRRFARLHDAGDCEVVFVSPETESELPDATRAGVLTVGDTEAFLARGGIIGFTMDGAKVRFAVNAVAAERAGLRLSSQLLKLAVRVEGRPAP